MLKLVFLDCVRRTRELEKTLHVKEMTEDEIEKQCRKYTRMYQKYSVTRFREKKI